ncbi:MAG: hypothetical protein ACYSWR_07260 [Planctomycetota bacterium]
MKGRKDAGSKSEAKTNDNDWDKKKGRNSRHNARKNEKGRTYPLHPDSRGLHTLLRKLKRAMLIYRLLLYARLL